MATLKQIRDKADAKLATFWVNLQTKQDAYFAKHGKYFQMLISPVDVVIDGLDSDYVDRVPSDEKFVIDRDFSFAKKIPFQIRVDEWNGSEGVGYIATVYVQLLDGRIFTRNRDSNQNDSGWYEYVNDNV